MLSVKSKQRSKAQGLSANLSHSKAQITNNGVDGTVLKQLITSLSRQIEFLNVRNRELANENSHIKKVVDVTLTNLYNHCKECEAANKIIKKKLDYLVKCQQNE